MSPKISVYTRKQAWRRCKYDNHIFKNEFTEVIEGIPTVATNKRNNLNIPLKKTRFHNIVYVTLIPTRQELDNLYRYYNSYLEFQKD